MFEELKKKIRRKEKEKQGIETSSEEITEFMKRKLPEQHSLFYQKHKFGVACPLLPMQFSVSFFDEKSCMRAFSHTAKIVVVLEEKLCQKGLQFLVAHVTIKL